MNKPEQDVLLRTERFVQQCLVRDSSGHDWWHIHRVRQITLSLAAQEGADSYVCELAALLHDVADEKLNDSKESGLNKVRSWLEQNQIVPDQIDHVMEIISTLSYNGGSNPPMRTLEGRVVQDADRLDALGAIGIARTFAYAGYKGHPMHDPDTAPSALIDASNYRTAKNGTAVHHFYEKLFKIKDTMNTTYGKELALERHEYMEQFLNQFYKEWEGE
ncbi:HD domain-containing protein [Paenibacillus sp. FJAT-26967]|uniref:HD domain-containing protein n=1 Tax=Paenibacillus sp. FJAT-26967 TaxID=1729690 RepID=UPI0008381F4E|nr:HD domain-containing protein [Paenibacillus sp. FJAT-26967]